MLRPALALCAALLALGAACGGSAGEKTAGGGVTDLTSVGQLRSAFEEDADAARLVLLLSPT